MPKDRAQELKEGLFKKGIVVNQGKSSTKPENAGLDAREIEALDAENVGGYGMKRIGGKWTKPGKK